jgi:hypothetical protein
MAAVMGLLVVAGVTQLLVPHQRRAHLFARRGSVCCPLLRAPLPRRCHVLGRVRCKSEQHCASKSKHYCDFKSKHYPNTPANVLGGVGGVRASSATNTTGFRCEFNGITRYSFVERSLVAAIFRRCAISHFVCLTPMITSPPPPPPHHTHITISTTPTPPVTIAAFATQHPAGACPRPSSRAERACALPSSSTHRRRCRYGRRWSCLGSIIRLGLVLHTRHTSHVTRHTSHVTNRTSHITRHTSHVTRYT